MIIEDQGGLIITLQPFFSAYVFGKSLFTKIEAYYDKTVDVHYFKKFRSTAYAHVPKEYRGKLDDKAIKYILIDIV